MRLLLRSLPLVVLLVASTLVVRARGNEGTCDPAGCLAVERVVGRPLSTATPLPSVVPSRAATASPTELAFPTVTPTPTLPPPPPSYYDLARRYGEQRFATLDSMPDDLRAFVERSVIEVAAFFEVDPTHLMTLMLARNPEGVALLVPEGGPGLSGLDIERWNGWANPQLIRYATDQRTIERFGGLGFDWQNRFLWEAWRHGRVRATAVSGTGASPTRFENGLAALARALGRYGDATLARLESPEPRESRLLPSPPAREPAADEALRDAYLRLLDERMGIRPDGATLAAALDGSVIAGRVARGELDPVAGAETLYRESEAMWVAAGAAAAREGRPGPWPFARSATELEIQKIAVQRLGHVLAPLELEEIAEATGGDPGRVEAALNRLPEAELWDDASAMIDARLQRSARGRPLGVVERYLLLEPLLAGRNMTWIDRWERDGIMADLERALRATPEFVAIHGDMLFESPPLDPMPRWVLKGFGTAASYQPGGIHTGLDLRGRRVGGREPPLLAVDDGIVVHVGPLYCLREGACRGPHAIVIDHGNQIYSIYSHNSEATVSRGQRVSAGDRIGRQGSEGFSRGSHLHLEVHVGTPYSGDWTQPWRGGQFVDPLPWLPPLPGF